MLKSLSIVNYALINQIEISFQEGFSIITGETGAGKSILLGALGLILGKRADTNVLLNKEQKCVVEGQFLVKDYDLHSFFREHELDYDEETIIRREILPSGKSRAFINDSPVNLSILQALTTQLIDIHSQHQNLNLNNQQFQLQVIDALAGNNEELREYKTAYKAFKEAEKSYKTLKETADKDSNELDYLQYQYQELEKAALQQNEDEALEVEQQELAHAEEIKEALSASVSLLTTDDRAILNQLRSVYDHIKSAASHLTAIRDIPERIESGLIELKDIAREIESWSGKINHDPERLELVNSRINLIYQLQQKHRVSSVKELIDVQQKLDEQISNIESFDDRLEELEKEYHATYKELLEKANALSKTRIAAGHKGQTQIDALLSELAMPHAQFYIKITEAGDITPNGKDDVQFLFSANKGMQAVELAKVASGGELSRVMLSVKSLLTHVKGLPTIIFDEIDTGVSGDVADKVGNIIKAMSGNMQVINITHLPQVASKGEHHFKVYKDDNTNATETHIKQLTEEERIQEIAKMLSGEHITDASLENAKELLRINQVIAKQS
ncbi:MAG: DNA repair protein RecN [Bacteroidetes bacterium]|jgi:DNA repair protein RecN (Recombination protein N)|nr:DNA repair protein RecN [Bacteroidota bacterium]